MSTYTEPLGFKNYGYDQVIAGEGAINYCVRWDSSSSVSADQRTSVESALQRSFNKWIEVLAGFDGFPYDEVAIKVVGWAVSDESLLEGDVSGIDVYTTTDADGIPQCDEGCGRFFHIDDDYSSCEGGAERHYGMLNYVQHRLSPFMFIVANIFVDQSLWLTEGFEGGAGGDWGQRLNQEEYMSSLDGDNHIYLHEVGHTFALDGM